MFDFDPFDMDFDGGVDLLGFDYFIRYVLRREDGDLKRRKSTGCGRVRCPAISRRQLCRHYATAPLLQLSTSSTR